MGYYKRAKRYYASGKRKYKRAKVWANTPQTPKALAIQAYNGVKYLKGLVNSERFYHDVPLFYNVSTSGTVIPLTNIPVGDGINNRTGHSILVRSLTYRFSLEISSAVTSNTRFLMLIVQDMQQVADTSPAITDILADTSPESLLNRNNLGRFKVLKRIPINLTPSSGGKPIAERSRYMNLYSHVRYNGVNGTDIQKGGYYLMMLSSEITNTPVVRGTFRIGYHDN